eukprot:TRINITY_DN2450_c0_g2_i1.p1 TRINITY_DN2450_c0_g2~~TRINITY_DN2450_c0_g2_i1.p1  ORF type:complete len:544 (-),score=82.01 TRINITY_DN2450_c0_g2_i1:267-1898(-)
MNESFNVFNVNSNSMMLPVNNTNGLMSPLTPQKEAAPIIAEWLKNTFVISDQSIPIKITYEKYQNFCVENRIEALNNATFGKLIRNVFPNLKKRRLGTRGKTAYYYHGIRFKDEEENKMLENSAKAHRKRKQHYKKTKEEKQKIDNEQEDEKSNNNKNNIERGNRRGNIKYRKMGGNNGENFIEKLERDSKNNPPPMNMLLLPKFTNVTQLNASYGNKGYENELLKEYRMHCQEVLNLIHTHAFEEVEDCCKEYWQDIFAKKHGYYEMTADVVDKIEEKDEIFYKTITASLLPTLLAPQQKSVQIRKFAFKFKAIMNQCVTDNSRNNNFVTRKLISVNRFCSDLYKLAGIHILSLNIISIFSDPYTVSEILQDLGKLHVDYINYQANSIFGFHNFEIDDNNNMDGIYNKYKKQSICSALNQFTIVESITNTVNTGKSNNIEEWLNWLNSIIRSHASPYSKDNPDLKTQMKIAQQTLLKFSFYFDIIIDELVFMNAPTLSHFYTMKAFFIEYLSFFLCDIIYCMIENRDFKKLFLYQFPEGVIL